MEIFLTGISKKKKKKFQIWIMKWRVTGNSLFLNFESYTYENVTSKNPIIMTKKHVLFILHIMTRYTYITLWSGQVSIVRMVTKWLHRTENTAFCFCGVSSVNSEVCSQYQGIVPLRSPEIVRYPILMNHFLFLYRVDICIKNRVSVEKRRLDNNLFFTL